MWLFIPSEALIYHHHHHGCDTHSNVDLEFECQSYQQSFTPFGAAVQNSWHCWTALQSLARGARFSRDTWRKRKRIQQESQKIHLLKNKSGAVAECKQKRGRILLLKLQISPTVEILREIRWMCVKAGNESSQHERWRERQAEREAPRGLAESSFETNLLFKTWNQSN